MNELKNNLGLVHYTLKRYFGGRERIKHTGNTTGFDYDDMFQIGSIALWHAMKTHDESKSKFGFYAVYMIRQKVWTEVSRKGSLVSRPQIKEIVPHHSINLEVTENGESKLDRLLGISYEDEWIHSSLLHEIMKGMDDLSIQIIDFLIQGYNKTEIGKMIGMKKGSVHNKIKRIRMEVREIWNGSQQPISS